MARRTVSPAPSLALLVLLGWAAGAAPSSGDEPSSSRDASGPTVRFDEVGQAAGVNIVHTNRDFGDRHKADILETFTDGGAVAAVGDVDGDGDEDLFLVESAEGAPNHLLLNDGPGADGVPRFREVTEQAGVGLGNTPLDICAEALFFDYDGDGRLDLLVARFGTPILWRQMGLENGVPTFDDVSERVGLTRRGNTISSIAFDADGDGWLDLLLGNYFREELNLLQLDTTKVLPNHLDYADNGGGVTFWLNRPSPDGAGRIFVDASAGSGMAHATGWTLDLGHSDLDLDGDQDLYVAGDFGTDRLFLGNGDGTFVDVTEQSVGWDTRKGMNAEIADYDGDLRPDIYVTNITDDYMKECNMLWQNQGLTEDPGVPGGQVPWFLDVSRETGTCDTDWGWGAKFGDFDNDGHLDLIATNGMRSAGETSYVPTLLEEVVLNPDVDFADLDSYPDLGDATWSGYQRNRLFHSRGNGTFEEIAGAAGVDNDFDGRGLALGDFDLDGRLDIVQTSAGEPALLYMNRSGSAGRWLGLHLVGEGSNHQAIGARVEVTARGKSFGSSGERAWMREVDGGNGYASSSTRRVHFGLSDAEVVTKIEIRWPSGREETIVPPEGETSLPLDRYLTIHEGQGIQ